MAITAQTVPSQRQRIQGRKWSLTGADGEGEWVDLSALQDRTVHIFGSFNGATVVIEGSNEAAPTVGGAGNAITLRDPAANNLSFTAAGLKAILELPRWIRPRVTAGTVTAVDVIINARGDVV